MHWSPDALTAIGRGRLYELAEQSRQPHRTTPLRPGARWTPASSRARVDSRTPPDYGCVDWFVYEDHHHRSEQERA
jgi:hypothetical protein